MDWDLSFWDWDFIATFIFSMAAGLNVVEIGH